MKGIFILMHIKILKQSGISGPHDEIKTMKLFDGNIWKNLDDFGFGNAFLNVAPKAQAK